MHTNPPEFLVRGDPRSDSFAELYASIFEISIEETWKVFHILKLDQPDKPDLHFP